MKFFKDITEKEFELIGGKAKSLCFLQSSIYNIGLKPYVDSCVAVPDGFVIFKKEFDEDELWKGFEKLFCYDACNCGLKPTVARSTVARSTVAAVDFVAVRSSANMEDSDLSSFAGIFQTFLYVDKKNLASKVNECFECVNLERVREYCNGKNIDFDKLKISVIVQKMVNSEISGVCFTRHPVTKDETQIVIEACFGLGEALVSGMITPDLYVCEKLNKKIVQRDVNEQDKIIILDKVNFGTKTVKVAENLKSK